MKVFKTVLTFFLIFLVLILAGAVGFAIQQLLSERKKASSLTLQLESRKTEAQKQLHSLDEQIAKCKQAYANLKAKAESELKRLQTESKTLAKTVIDQKEKMKRWQVIVDAEAEAKRVLSDAATEATRLQQAADQVLTEARASADAILRKADTDSIAAASNALQITGSAESDANRIRETARRESDQQLLAARRESDALKNEATKLLELSRMKASEVLAEAERQAKEIAGEAYDVKQDIGKYEKILRALKNELQGYGDEYIVPSHSLLDELAEEFAYAEAGQKLKDARTTVKSMVKESRAAICDYVQANRRETAIRFVVDAFNGKVDSTLALVKHDNFGKLSQQIKDSFTLVNSNGEAFRNAHITQEYLNARLEELKWAVVANELKKRDQEEQRLIRERIREEQKAKREYERALKEAKREEEVVQKAMVKLQEQMSKASAEERAKYEGELQVLQEKLKLAEEKG